LCRADTLEFNLNPPADTKASLDRGRVSGASPGGVLLTQALGDQTRVQKLMLVR